ncbi:MAG TPA: hypothetical protein VGI06_10825, partial [Acidimicrobiales bacterium]
MRPTSETGSGAAVRTDREEPRGRRENGDRGGRDWAPSGPQRGNVAGEGEGAGRRRRRRGRDRSAPEREPGLPDRPAEGPGG